MGNLKKQAYKPQCREVIYLVFLKRFPIFFVRGESAGIFAPPIKQIVDSFDVSIFAILLIVD